MNQVMAQQPYDTLKHFSGSRARVEKDGTLMYIDHSAAVVWEER